MINTEWGEMEIGEVMRKGTSHFDIYGYKAAPYFNVTHEMLSQLPTPFYIWGLHYKSEVGTVDWYGSKEYVVEGFDTFVEYLESKSKKQRQSYERVLKHTESLIRNVDGKHDIMRFWNFFETKFPTTDKVVKIEYELRKRIFDRPDMMKTMYVNPEGEAVGINVAYVKDGTLFDMACLRMDISGLGIVACLDNIKFAIENGLIYNMLNGDFDYKMELASNTIPTKRVVIGNHEFMKKMELSETDMTKQEGFTWKKLE